MVLPQAISTAPGPIVVEGAFRPLTVSMSMTTFLVEHPQARFLIDPAMCADVHAQVVPLLPRAIRRVVAPNKPVLGLGEALSGAGRAVTDVDFILPTHLHWDHIAGLLELPAHVPVHATVEEHTAAMQSPVTELLLRRQPFDPYVLDGPPVLTFTSSFDLFGDGAVVLVDLAGHTPGSVGILLALDDGTRVLLAGDAVWHSRQITLIREKAPFPVISLITVAMRPSGQSIDCTPCPPTYGSSQRTTVPLSALTANANGENHQNGISSAGTGWRITAGAGIADHPHLGERVAGDRLLASPRGRV